MGKVNILWSGITGRTGKLALELSKENDFVTIVAGLSNSNSNYYNYDKLDEITEAFDVIVDFSHEDNLEKILKLALKYHKPLIIGTYITNSNNIKMIEKASKAIPIFKGGNFRFKVKKFIDDVVNYAKETDDDIKIIETHDKNKEVPSQTAIEIKNLVLNETGKKVEIDSRLEYDERINDWKVANLHCRVQGITELVPDVFKIAYMMYNVTTPGLYSLNQLIDNQNEEDL